jgi:hypothetical protein
LKLMALFKGRNGKSGFQIAVYPDGYWLCFHASTLARCQMT